MALGVLALCAGAASAAPTASGQVHLVEEGAENAGRPLAEVLVTDGYSFTRTDGEGRYGIELHEDARWVAFVNPRGTMPTERFYHLLPEQADAADTAGEAFEGLDFTVEPLPHPPDEPFRFVHQSDLHISREYHVARNDEKLVRHINRMPGPPAFVMDSGDLSNDSREKMQWAREIFDRYEMPVFPAHGNHDQDIERHSGVPARDDYRGQSFERLFAPLYYAYTYGNYLFINSPWLSHRDEAVAWHAQVLSRLGEDFHVVSNQHHWDGLRDRYRELFDLLKAHNAVGSFTGHYHTAQMLEIEGVPQFKVNPADGMSRDLDMGAFSIITAHPDGRMIADHRHRGFERDLGLVHPREDDALRVGDETPVLVNAYDTALDMRDVRATVREREAQRVLAEIPLSHGGGRAWSGRVEPAEEWPDEVRLRIEVTDESGARWPALERAFVVKHGQASSARARRIRPGEDWPMWQGDPARRGAGREGDGPAPPLELAWVHVNHSFGLSAPIVADGRVFVGVMNNVTPTEPFPTVHALDATTGASLWQHEVTGGRSVRSTLASDGQAVIALLCDGTVVALAAESGERLWEDSRMRTTLRRHQVFIRASPLIADGRAMIGLGGFAAAFDLEDGHVAWSEIPDGGGRGWAYPSAVKGQGVFFDGLARARDPGDGALLAAWENETMARSTLTPVLGERYLIAPVAVERERWIVKAIEPTTGEVAWRTPMYGEIRRYFSSPAAHQGRVYFLFGHRLMALDEATGDILWRTWLDGAGKRRGGRIRVDAHGEIGWVSPADEPDAIPRVAGDYDYASKHIYEVRSMHAPPVVAGDHVYVVTTEGVLHAFAATTGEPVWQFDLQTQVSSGLAVSGNALFVTGRNGALYAFVETGEASR